MGQCKSVVGTTMCPTVQGHAARARPPRGQSQPLRNIYSGKHPPYDPDTTDAMRAVTDYCIECRYVRRGCPSNVNIPKLMLESQEQDPRSAAADRRPAGTPPW